MKFINKLLGKGIYGVAKLVELIFNAIISLIELLIELIKSFFKGFFLLLTMGGCLLFIIVIGPLGLSLLFNPLALSIVLLMILFPFVGVRFVDFMRYMKYSITEYLYNTSEHLISGIKYRSFKYFRDEYIRAKREEAERQRERYYQQQREWEARFKQQWGRFGSGANYSGQQTSGGYASTPTDFKLKYQKSCDTLGVSYNATRDQIKSAYRKMAKKYHPDINKEDNANEMFQKISRAYEFLTEENIEKYRSLT